MDKFFDMFHLRPEASVDEEKVANNEDASWLHAKGGGANHINKANGLISTARLNPLPDVHLPPIYPVVFREAHREYLSWSVLRA